MDTLEKRQEAQELPLALEQAHDEGALLGQFNYRCQLVHPLHEMPGRH